MKVLLLSRYDNLGASSRYRSYQYIEHLNTAGIAVSVLPLLSNDYLKRLYAGSSIPVGEVVRSYIRRCLKLVGTYPYDLTWVEYEAFPWIPYWLESLLLSGRKPYVIDYDDAVYHRYDLHSSMLVRKVLGRKIDGVMKGAACVIAGNEYIAAHAREAGAKRVEIIPTVVDLSRYPRSDVHKHAGFTIGWIGTPQTVRYLTGIGDALRAICRNEEATLMVIGASSPGIDGVSAVARPWSEDTEVSEISRCDVGIMPLENSPWERGKCGQKLIQYMACSLPVVASPVGINSTIVEHGVNGFLASNTDEWTNALTALRQNPQLRKTMGAAGRAKVERLYNSDVTAPRLASLLKQLGGERH